MVLNIFEKTLLPFVFGTMAVLILVAASADGVIVITDADIIPTDNNGVGSGNGTLDYVLFTESAGGAGNSNGSFDGDDANTDMPTGNSSPTATESFVTSFGDLRGFYIDQFPDGGGGSTVNEIVIYVDVNQVSGGSVLTLNTFEIWIDYFDGLGGAFGDDRDDPWGTDNDVDVSSALQNSTNTDFSGGTLLATLDGAKALPINEQGAGFADYAIRTHIDPFDGAYSDSTRVLFFWDSTGHDDGGDSVFLSGEYEDDTFNIPEPGTMGLLALAGGLLLIRRKRS